MDALTISRWPTPFLLPLALTALLLGAVACEPEPTHPAVEEPEYEYGEILPGQAQGGDGLSGLDGVDDFLLESWDLDRDGMVDEVEFDRGAVNWFGAAPRDEVFRSWDDDSDGMLDGGEFSAALIEAEYYDRLDADGDGDVEEGELNARLVQ